MLVDLGPRVLWAPNSLFREMPPAPPDELSDPNLPPLPTHPRIKYVEGALAAIIVRNKAGEKLSLERAKKLDGIPENEFPIVISLVWALV